MEKVLGLLRIRILRGINLAVRDVRSSDPYVIARMGKQKLKTRVIKKNVNPEWNEELTFSVTDPNIPIMISVFDKDTFSFDDKMGDAEFDIKTLSRSCTNAAGEGEPPQRKGNQQNKTTRQNCLAEESCIIWKNGKLVQDMFLRLRNVESGEIELQLQWIDVPGSRALWM